MKLFLFFISIFLFSKNSFSQFGKNGALTINSANTILNEYATLSINANSSQNQIIVSNINDLNVSSNLTCGDLIFIYQAQGASINNSNTIQYGNILSYGNAGLYELHHVVSVSGNTITIDAPLTNNYLTSGHTQIIKVPQYSNLNINSLGSLTTPAWDGNKGGVVVIHSLDSILVTGEINVTGKGFRGGIRRTSGYVYTGTQYVSNVISHGGEKGEGIAGSTSDYDLIGGRYCRGAAANGGGGGTNHNAGGGGGANATNGNAYNGSGVMCNTCTGSAAWLLDADYISNSGLTNSSGGGKGGNTYANSNQDALVTPPGTSSWSGDGWRNVGGRGGHPLTNINASSRIYFGGGGGAGDANDNSGGSGANGGGLIILITPKINGTGIIVANGDSAQNSFNIHADALGGGGGGGSIILNSNSVSNTLNVNAIGGKGGSMISLNAGFLIGSGAGGGGGYVNYPTGSSPNVNIGGGLNGKNYHTWISEFPSYGATIGGSGFSQSLPVFNVVTNYTAVGTSTISINSVINDSLCAGQSAVIFPGGSNNFSITPTNSTGVSFTVSPTSTTTYTISDANLTCGTVNTVVTIYVAPSPTLSINSQTICSGQSATLTALGATNYTWSVNNATTNSITVSPTASSVYTVTGTNGTSCSTSQTVSVNVINTPSLTVNTPSICSGETVTLTVNGATNYTWSSAGSISNPNTSNPTVTPSVTTNYSVTGANSMCNSQTVTTVFVSPNPTISVSGNTFVCNGQSTTLSASGASTYTWNTGVTSSSISVSPTTNTTYTVMGTTGSCTSQTIITVNSSSNIIVTGGTTICSGQTAVLTANGATSYTWTNPSSLSSSSGNTVIASPISTTNYTVLGTINSCTNSAVVSVSVNPTPTITTVSYTNTSCGLNNGSVDVVSIPFNNTYTWSPGVSSSTNTANALASGSYTISAYNQTCYTSTVVNILSSNPLQITSTSITPSDCGMTNGAIIVQDNYTNSTYSWSPNVSLTNTATNLSPSNYALTITNGSCSTSTVFVVPQLNGPNAMTINKNDAICESLNGKISVTSVSNGTAPYQYSFNNSSFSSVSTFSNLSQGVYTITVKDSNGCTYTNTIIIGKSFLTPNIQLTTNLPSCNSNDGSFYINNITGGTEPFLLSFNGLPFSTISVFEGLGKGDYVLIVRDSNLCETNLLLEMPIDKNDYTLYVPNTFTPNNDIKNDTWFVKGTCINAFNCIIFNRWGEKIIELKDINEKWDGTYMGRSVPDGVYVYLIEAETNNGTVYKNGHITLFR